MIFVRLRLWRPHERHLTKIVADVAAIFVGLSRLSSYDDKRPKIVSGAGGCW